MKLRVGINGLGRIGRGLVRANTKKKIFDVVAVNEINNDNENIAYTLNYDTLYGQTENKYKADGDFLVRTDTDEKIKVFHQNCISDVDWESLDVDYVIDASGILNNVINSRRMLAKGSIKRIFITHAPDQVDFSMVLGANESLLDLDKHKIISTSICDATALAPVLKVMDDNFSIKNGYITTLHPWLNYQNLMDGQSSSWSVPGEIYHHFALGRSAIGNMIPKPTSAISAVHKVLPLQEGIIGSFSFRTPTAIIGSADVTLNLEKPTTKESIIKIFENYQINQELKIINNNIDPLVSLDFVGSEFSVIVDHRWTEVIDKNLAKLVLWYDNEFGYCCRVLDQVNYVYKAEIEKGYL